MCFSALHLENGMQELLISMESHLNGTANSQSTGVKKRPFMVRTRDDVLTCARHIHSDALAPIFLTSSVTGADPLTHLLFCKLSFRCILC